jgi:hypothetical protein
MSERDDELLRDVPPHPPPSSLTGYRHGRWLRLALFGAITLVVVVAVLAGRWWANEMEQRHREAAADGYVVDETGVAVENRPSELVWTHGKARLGLSRRSPGVQTIRLPDRILRLADGHENAQVKVDVAGRKTKSLVVLYGDIVQEPLPEEEESQPAPAAKGK